MEFIVDHKTLGDLPYAINLKGMELTRCRDCQRWATEMRFTAKCIGPDGILDPNGFCSRGERKEANDES